MGKGRYSVYVIELSNKVYSENRKFREANPQYNGVLECLYVGMTSKNPKTRFLEHMQGSLSKKGYKLSSALVKKYGKFLRPSLYQKYNPMTKKEATKMEKELANELKRKRYAVWYN